ncbi:MULTISPECIES: DNA cytosine methyltransferase [unclassified Microbacterium]|uniref:DNA cytosine methyltransferase n=1 Tax=unclassified Microbacterium TaxID=2609290 RepID=UPI001BB17D51|nr:MULTISPECIES: DNA cytosine methyltransferase [unclassified Microbacterium]
MAGNGEGRAALDDVLTAIDEERWKDAASLHGLTEHMDPRTALVLTPLAHIWGHRPELVALEQVPEVLPVWHAIARVLRRFGYSVWAGILRAEQYGVPQTRKRAILMARLDGKVSPPTPTHSRYYSIDPTLLDPGVKKWVSMAEALGFEGEGRVLRSNYSDGSTGELGERDGVEPAPTLTSKADRMKWVARKAMGAGRVERHGEQSGTSLRLTYLEAAALQSFPTDMAWPGNQGERFLAIGNAVPPLLAQAVLSALLAPAGERDAWDQVFAEVSG